MKFVVGKFLKKLQNIKGKSYFRGEKVKYGYAANLSTLISPYCKIEPKMAANFALCGPIKPPSYTYSAKLPTHFLKMSHTCTTHGSLVLKLVRLKFLPLPLKILVKVVFNQACKYASNRKKILTWEVNQYCATIPL